MTRGEQNALRLHVCHPWRHYRFYHRYHIQLLESTPLQGYTESAQCGCICRCWLIALINVSAHFIFIIGYSLNKSTAPWSFIVFLGPVFWIICGREASGEVCGLEVSWYHYRICLMAGDQRAGYNIRRVLCWWWMNVHFTHTFMVENGVRRIIGTIQFSSRWLDCSMKITLYIFYWFMVVIMLCELCISCSTTPFLLCYFPQPSMWKSPLLANLKCY